MTQEQIEIMDQVEKLDSQGYIIEPHWAFIGYSCTIIIIGNDHDADIKVDPPNGKISFDTKWDAYKEGIKYVTNILKDKLFSYEGISFTYSY